MLQKYSKWCSKNWNSNPKRRRYTKRDDFVMSLGLAGETGEVIELLKKAVRDKHDLNKVDRKELVKELGDVLYYWMIICDRFKIDPEHVMKMNVDKLVKRRAAAAKKKKLLYS